ncbi:heavy metal-responsive transcriptional regulator [Moorena sp. SIO3I6]|uniref:heavy metal-responsive transcriptional regulator n=1 Tax=Moorena sp. SIO3I6 TaxID=2607831 RepID=UPI0013FB10BF|nr:heavy metal-responsive transcriptional regulator [Moorena sp. SIO3I6]NEP29048.1 heavy metal-responsive transcriptional regulator [Moorena sp. SIO3I6]
MVSYQLPITNDLVTNSSEDWLKIGQVASYSGLPVKTIRYYEEIGLLVPVTTRSPSGYRLFTRQVLNRLAFIKRAQSLGLSLSEIQDILKIHDFGELPCGAVKQHLLLKIEAITEQIEALELLKSELLGIISGWQEHPPDAVKSKTICPNLGQKATLREQAE